MLTDPFVALNVLKFAFTVEKLRPDELTGVSETLLIPLHYRVEESRKESSPFRDEIGERFHDFIAYDWSKFQVRSFHSRIMAARTAILDEQVGKFLHHAPDGLVVNLGAGLDTRFYRLDNGTAAWIELDLPGVISFRCRLQEPDDERQTRSVFKFVEDELFSRRFPTEAWLESAERVSVFADPLIEPNRFSAENAMDSVGEGPKAPFTNRTPQLDMGGGLLRRCAGG